MPACQGPQATVPDADVDSAANFLGCLYIVSLYTVRLMTPCVRRILCLRNKRSVPYFRQPPNLPTAARRNRKCTECGTTAFGRNRMSAESAHLSTSGAETEAEIRSTFSSYSHWRAVSGSKKSGSVYGSRCSKKSPAFIACLRYSAQKWRVDTGFEDKQHWRGLTTLMGYIYTAAWIAFHRYRRCNQA